MAMTSEPVDMSPEAIDRRLRELGDLWSLWLRLRRDGLAKDVRESGPELGESGESAPKRLPPS